MKEHIIRLTDEARQRLQELVQAGKRSVRVVRRAQILLKSDAGLIDKEIAAHLGCSERHIRDVRRRFCTTDLERALYDAPRSGRPPTFTMRQQQQVIALACTDPPEGRTRWTLELLCQHAVQRGYVPALSKTEVALWLRAHDLKPWRKKHGAFLSLLPSSGNAWKTFSTSTRSQPKLRHRSSVSTSSRINCSATPVLGKR